jgi:hypothetical protein
MRSTRVATLRLHPLLTVRCEACFRLCWQRSRRGSSRSRTRRCRRDSYTVVIVRTDLRGTLPANSFGDSVPLVEVRR